MPGGKGAKTRPCSAHVRCSVWLLTVGVARPCLVFNCLCSTVNQQKCFLFEYCLPSDALVSTSFLLLLVRHLLLVAMHLLLIASSFFGSCVPECFASYFALDTATGTVAVFFHRCAMQCLDLPRLQDRVVRQAVGNGWQRLCFNGGPIGV